MLGQTLQEYLTAHPADKLVKEPKESSLRSVLQRMKEKYRAEETRPQTMSPESSVPSKVTTVDPSSEKPMKPEDKAFIDGLKTKINYLRHKLNQADASSSGCVNGAEFKSTLLKAGFSKDDDKLVKNLFDANAERDTLGYTIGTYSRWRGASDYECRGRTVNIENFLKRLETTKTGSDENSLLSAKALEERRVLRKALLATRQNGNSYKLLKEMSRETPGRLDVTKVKESLALLGANISPNEMDVVVEAVGVKPDGRVDIEEFDEKLRQSIDFFDKIANIASHTNLKSHRRYHNSIRSHDDLIGPTMVHNQEYDDGIKRSIEYRKDQVLWSKLQKTLQENSKAIIASMSSEGNGWSINNLSGKLSDAGIQLGEEDAKKLEAKIKKRMEMEPVSSEIVPLEKFCEVTGIRLALSDRGRPIHVDVDSIHADGGIFNSSRRSMLGNPTYSVSMLTEDKRTGRVVTPFKTKRRLGQVIHEHTYQPSKFWELNHSDSHLHLMSAVPDFDRGSSISPTNRVRWGARSPKRGKRSTSAPPVKLSDLLVESSFLKSGSMISGITRSDSSRYRATRWANRSLADFISVTTAGGSETSHPFPSDPTRRKNSLKRMVIPPSTTMAPPFAVN